LGTAWFAAGAKRWGSSTGRVFLWREEGKGPYQPDSGPFRDETENCGCWEGEAAPCCAWRRPFGCRRKGGRKRGWGSPGEPGGAFFRGVLPILLIRDYSGADHLARRGRRRAGTAYVADRKQDGAEGACPFRRKRVLVSRRGIRASDGRSRGGGVGACCPWRAREPEGKKSALRSRGHLGG